jgi:enterochelin esterase-like enzyme
MRRLPRAAVVAALVMLAGVLAACDPMSQAAIPTPANTNTPTPTLTATATITPTPSATPTPVLTPTATPFPCDEGGEVVEIAPNRSASAGEDIPYRVYLPPCYQQTLRRYPLVILLPSQAGDPDEWEGLGLVSLLDAGIRSQVLPPMVVAMPVLGRSGGRDIFPPDPSYEGFLLDDLLPALNRDFCLYERREYRALGGLGRGGFWALSIGLRYPTVFGAVGGHSASLPAEVPPAYNPPDIARNSADLSASGLRIYMDSGVQDTDVAAGLQRLSDRLTARQIAHTYLINPIGVADAAYWTSHLGEYLAFYGQPWPRDLGSLPDCRQPSP